MAGYCCSNKIMMIWMQKHLQIVTHRKPSPAEMKIYYLLGKLYSLSDTNAIVYAKNLTTLGVGQVKPAEFLVHKSPSSKLNRQTYL